MGRFFEKSLDEQFALEQERRDADARFNRRFLWIMLPLGAALAVVSYYLDISTRIAVPVMVELQDGLQYYDPTPDYDVFRLSVPAFTRLLPSALIAGTVGIWIAVYATTYNGRKFMVGTYFLTGFVYTLIFTAIMGFLIPLNVWILNKFGLSITDLEIPFSDEITSFGPEAGVFPLAYLISGMERGIWAGAAVIILSMVAARLSGGLTSFSGKVRPATLSLVMSLIVVMMLLFGPLGIHQFLFDQFIRLPEVTEGVWP